MDDASALVDANTVVAWLGEEALMLQNLFCDSIFFQLLPSALKYMFLLGL